MLIAALLLAVMPGRPAHAELRAAARSLALPGVVLADARLVAAPGDDGALRVSVHAARVDVPVLGWRRVALSMDGTLRRDPQLRWQLAAALKLRGAAGEAFDDAQLALSIDPAGNTLEANLTQKQASAGTRLPLDQPSHLDISLDHLPASWLQGLLAQAWSGRLGGGNVDAKLSLDSADRGFKSSGQIALRGIAFDTPTGRLAGQKVDGGGRVGIDTTGAASRFDFDGALHGGELLLGPLYARLPDHPVQLALGATARAGRLAFDRLRVDDPDALTLDGALGFDPKGELESMRLDRVDVRFPAGYQRYGRSWLEAMGLRDLVTTGSLRANLDLRADGWHAFGFDTPSLSVANADGSVAWKRVRGGLDWSIEGTRPATTLAWDALEVHGMLHGAGQSRWQSHRGALSLKAPLDLPLLDGRLRIPDLDWRPAAAKGQRLSTALAVQKVDMAALCRAVGWPAFPGTLEGSIPSLRWIDDRFELGGGLTMNVFGGQVLIDRLAWQGPFKPAATLTGDIAIKRLDLAAITSVFDFGDITGRMDGRIDQLKLVDWSPVAFDASLIAPDGGRISQRAVNNLTAVGGGGIAGGLQGAVLKLFKTFGYRRIGLSCALRGSVCRMGGLQEAADGFTIVEGSGLPHLQVIGHQHDVDWPTLVRRIDAAIHGQAPQIR